MMPAAFARQDNFTWPAWVRASESALTWTCAVMRPAGSIRKPLLRRSVIGSQCWKAYG